MRRRLTSVAVALALVVTTSVARATPDFPGVVVSFLRLPGVTIDAPQGCTLCHTTNAGGTSLQPFGQLLLQDGAQPYDESSLEQALQKVQSEEPQLIGDIKAGQDPNDDAAAFGDVSTPRYGCDSGGRGAPGHPLQALIAAVALALAAAGRRRVRQASRRRARMILLLFPLLCGCGAPGAGGGPSTEPAPCDPQAPMPTSLGTILGVGRDAEGTFYVADQDATAATLGRVFVSTGQMLHRRHVSAAQASGPASGLTYALTFDDAGSGLGSRVLIVRMRGTLAAAMALAAPNGAEAALEVVPPSSARKLSVVDLPSSAVFVGDVRHGTQELVVFGTRDDTGPSALQVFFGPPPQLVQYPIAGLDLGATTGPTLSFGEGSSIASLQFTSATAPGREPFSDAGEVTVETSDGQTLAVVPRVPTPTSLPGISFFCLGS